MKETATLEYLRRRFPWLTMQVSRTEYLGPDYYQQILRPYIFGGKTDLELLREWLQCAPVNAGRPALEIGPGPGRATSVFLSVRQEQILQVVDLSSQMLSYCRGRFSHTRQLIYTQSDAIEFLRRCETSFSGGFSLWSLSHSIHRAMQVRGMLEGEHVSREAMVALLTRVLEPGARFLLIHFDPDSPEQRISLRQRSRLQPFLATPSGVPSRRIIDAVCAELAGRGVITVDVQHLRGEPIRYPDMDDALEVFMNLHMEGMFNEHPLLPDVMRDLRDDLAEYQFDDGHLAIEPGCYLYRFEIRQRPSV